MTPLTTPISITHTTPAQFKQFSSGEPILDEYLRRFAKKHEKINIGRTFVLLQNDTQRVIGYYTICSAEISLTNLPHLYREKLPRYPIPTSRLCRLAVDKSYQGQRLGSHLLIDAIKRILHVDKSMAVHSLIVDAKNSRAKEFYVKFGFIPYEDNESTLFLPLATFKKSEEWRISHSAEILVES